MIVISDFDFVLMFRLNVVRLMLYDLFCLFRIFGFFSIARLDGGPLNCWVIRLRRSFKLF